MRLLLDTNVAIWAWQAPERLSDAFKARLSDGRDDAWLSAATLWEMSIKQAIGKLKLPKPAIDWVPEMLKQFPFSLLDMTGRHALVAGGLPRIHADPFDRMLVAQAREEGFMLVTSDAIFRRYGIPLMLV